MNITVDEAREYFRDPSQRLMGVTPENLPDDVEYRAIGPLCLIFHRALWPDVWMVHCAAKPEGWGKLDQPAATILAAFWAEVAPQRIIAWISETNRPVAAFARRLGFTVDGKMDLPSGSVIQTGWRPTWA